MAAALAFNASLDISFAARVQSARIACVVLLPGVAHSSLTKTDLAEASLFQRVCGLAMVIVTLFPGGMWMRATQSAPAAPRAKRARKPETPEKAVMPENFHPPEVTLALASASGKDVEVDLTMVNHGPDNFRVLKWNLPDGEELSSNLFTMTRDGREVAYHGKMVKRRVTPESYRALLPDKEYTVRIKLSPAYDVSAPGHYQMHYQVLNQSGPDAEKLVLTLLKSNELELFK